MKKYIWIILIALTALGAIDKNTVLDFINLLWKFVKQHTLLVAILIGIIAFHDFFMVKLYKPLPKCPRCGDEMFPVRANEFECPNSCKWEEKSET